MATRATTKRGGNRTQVHKTTIFRRAGRADACWQTGERSLRTVAVWPVSQWLFFSRAATCRRVLRGEQISRKHGSRWAAVENLRTWLQKLLGSRGGGALTGPWPDSPALFCCIGQLCMYDASNLRLAAPAAPAAGVGGALYHAGKRARRGNWAGRCVRTCARMGGNRRGGWDGRAAALHTHLPREGGREGETGRGYQVQVQTGHRFKSNSDGRRPAVLSGRVGC